MNEGQLIRSIKALVSKGDQAKDKSEQYYVAAGKHLETLKDSGAHKREDMTWDAYVSERCGIGKSRAYELMQIADGRKTTEDVRADRRDRDQKAISKKKSPPVGGENSPTQSTPYLPAPPALETPEDDDDVDYGPQTTGVVSTVARRNSILARAAEAVRLAEFDSVVGLTIDDEIRTAVRRAANAWNAILQQIEANHETKAA